ncbi:liver carboxylesterase 1-like isoform X2 [Microtus pennsylvanicus]|uniref:liver carboxylesterase 1-like isoform X2 n=1 Tax=Microtus pennsylvanicus TaxID=10058 RepID=UPI003F6D30F7
MSDGVVLPKAPEEILAEKSFNTVPYMVGITKKEFGWSMPMMIGFPLSEDKMDEKRIASLLWQSYPILNISESLIPAVIEKYISGTDNPIRKKDLLQDLMGDVMFGAPSVIVSRGHRDTETYLITSLLRTDWK